MWFWCPVDTFWVCFGAKICFQGQITPCKCPNYSIVNACNFGYFWSFFHFFTKIFEKFQKSSTPKRSPHNRSKVEKNIVRSRTNLLWRQGGPWKAGTHSYSKQKQLNKKKCSRSLRKNFKVAQFGAPPLCIYIYFKNLTTIQETVFLFKKENENNTLISSK